MIWDAALETLNQVLEIYKEQSSPQFQYKKKINNIYKSYIATKDDVEELDIKIKKELLKDNSDGDKISVMMLERQKIVNTANKLEKQLSELYKMKDIILAKNKTNNEQLFT